jgi:hypothetical protein
MFARARLLRREKKAGGPVSDIQVGAGFTKRDRNAEKPKLLPKGTANNIANNRAVRRLMKLQERADRRGLKRDMFADFKPIGVV